MTTIRTMGPNVARFFAANLRFPEGAKIGEPFVLDQWQEDILDLIYEVGDDGRPKWRTVLLGIPRGNGKSPLAGGIADYELVSRKDSPQVFCAAAAREQAGIVHRFAYDMPKGGPLDDFIAYPRVRTALGAMKSQHNDGILRVLAADGDLQHGLNPSVVIVDELHSFKTGKQVELYAALSTAMHKRPDSVMLIITTAGSTKASLLGEKFDAMIKTHDIEYRDNGCLTIGRNEEAESLLIWYGAPEDADVSDPAVWRACNPASWISDKALRRAAMENPESWFKRLYLNQWVLGSDAAIQPSAWDACQLDGTIAEGDSVWVGVDIGERRDCSSVVMVSPKGGRVRAEAKVYNPAKEHRKSMLPLVEAELRRIADTYQLRTVAFDGWQMRDLANRLESDGMPMKEFPQNPSHMVPASQALYDLINQKVIAHNGDLTLRSHMLSAAAKTEGRGGWRFAKPMGRAGREDSTQKIDACIALTMACSACADDDFDSEPASVAFDL